ncbi:uncharacterized protein BP5553_00920 [Venustampulla echinocandica]|uniref:Epoxide hydrolase N-terminal domain-containing protein n=1 Tax=Venustampulla echinocandica TaxID=2656787 RepID=A0A370TZI7_9HELO|nr:uncharacterized protein BP5553_00920 [Venustampulla echinocandica]RDL40941.1 hypothetical protein BP5553_00920 [Venustampulla echinocandica]
MGASDSKLVFKRGIFKLSEDKAIPADDPYWTSFWELPETAEDVFSLFSPADIRRTRDTSLENLETLILAVTSRLFILRHHPSFPDPEFAPEKDALNCIRVLTRVLPYIYEAEQLQAWEDKFFWGVRRKRTRRAALARDVLFDESQEELAKLEAAGEEFEEVKPLAEELIDTLIDLLFFADFTLPKAPNTDNKVTYAIWTSGVGCNNSVGTSREFESNRTEVLRLLLTLTSPSMYMSANLLPVQGVKAVSYIVTCPDKQVVLSVLCSLLNTSLKYNPASWKIPYNVQVFKDPKLILVTYALQFLLVVLLYPIPESDPAHAKKNYFRHFLGRLHRPQDFQFITEGITRVLNHPLQSSTSYIPGNQNSNKLTSEMIMVFWEMTQCNKRFRSFIIDTNRSHDFLVLILYYAIDYKLDASKQGIVRMCVFILQTLSVEASFGKSLNKRFENQDTLPPAIRLQNFYGSYADFLIHSIYNIITTSQGKLTAIYPALLAVINNIAAYLECLSPSASSKLLQLFSSMSSPGFLLTNDSNHDLLRSLLESMNAILEHRYNKNPNFVYAVLRNKKRFDALRSFTLESGQEEIERRNRRRKDNPSDQFDMSDSRRGSADSIRSPSSSHHRAPTLSNVPEEDGAFAIGDDEDEDTDDEYRATPSESTPTDHPSRASSVSSSIDDAVPTQLRGMSEKARGKMPGRSLALLCDLPADNKVAGMPTFSRQNSTTSLGSHTTPGYSTNGAFEPTAQWIESWLPELPLHTVLTLIEQLSPQLPRPNGATTDTPSASVLRAMQTADIRGIEPSSIRIQYFEWSPLSLGWYESLLWSFIFTSEMQVAKGTVGVWNGTAIKLFRVETVAPIGPTLSSPRGAVDAVGSNIVNRIGSINLRGVGGTAPGAGSGSGDAQGGNANQGDVREARTGTGNGSDEIQELAICCSSEFLFPGSLKGLDAGIHGPAWSGSCRSLESLEDEEKSVFSGFGDTEANLAGLFRITSQKKIYSKYMEGSAYAMSGTGLQAGNVHGDEEEVKNYTIHVSNKYLQLTKRKLELTRLPHELIVPPSQQWSLGTPKREIEPLIDFWLDAYDWRQQEVHLNSTLPQYRTLLRPGDDTPLVRLHFIHIRSPHADAIPLLLIPTFPLTNLSLSPLFAPLADPANPKSTLAFHVVVPSIPGLGFSSAFSTREAEGDVLEITAGLFDKLMKRLGYGYYVASATGSGRSSMGGIDYYLPRLVGERFPQSCLGVHLLDPIIEEPKFGGDPWMWLKWRIARFFYAGIFGYHGDDWKSLSNASRNRITEKVQAWDQADQTPLLKRREGQGYGAISVLGLNEPNTFSYALCDSPVGLLSLVCSALRRTSPRHELSHTEIIDLCQLAWLPGPEAGARFWAAAVREAAKLRKKPHPRTNIGITAFGVGALDGEGYAFPAWAAGEHNVLYSQRVVGRPGLAAWERTDIIVGGIRALAKELQGIDARLKTRPLEEYAMDSEDESDWGQTIADSDKDYGLQLDVESPDTVVQIPLSTAPGDWWGDGN